MAPYIGTTIARIPQGGSSSAADHLLDGQDGDILYPYGQYKVIATIGEVDSTTGKALTGYPDGNAAWLKDNDTVRVAYQSESYATMSNETYPWVMDSGVSFTGSHIHTIDYDRSKFADFLNNNDAAASMVKGSGLLFSTVYNVFGEIVDGKNSDATDLSAKWGNQTKADGTLIPFKAGQELTQADFFFHSFCGSWYEKANKWGSGIGFADDVWLMAEEWNIGSSMFDNGATDSNATMGLASMVVDIANETAYTAPALGQTGYEKIVPLNPGNEDYVVISMSGYNHDQEPVPNRIYVGIKDKLADGSAINYATASERDKFLARNGLLYGKLYGLAIDGTTASALGVTPDKDGNGVYDDKVMDDYLKNAAAPDSFSGRFYATSYRWDGFDTPEAVQDTEMMLWEKAAEQPSGYTFFNGDSKLEHAAADPDKTKTRFIQNMTDEGGMLGFDLSKIQSELAAAGGKLPEYLSVDVTRTLAAVDGALTLETGGLGKAHTGTNNPDGSKTAATHVEGKVAKTIQPDGLQWLKTADGDFLIVDEDSGNDYGERRFVLPLDSETLKLKEDGVGFLLSIGGGSLHPRAKAGVASLPGAFSRATSTEHSGTWNVTGLVAQPNGRFLTIEELSGTGEQDIISGMSLADQLLIGVIQHAGESGGDVASGLADQGGQINMFNFNIPNLETRTNRINSSPISSFDTIINRAHSDDTVTGTSGNDLITGMGGEDVLNGGDGDDDINGNQGNDTITGGSGADFFRLSKGNDVITDFNIAQGDKVGIMKGQGYVISQTGNDLKITRDGYGETILKGVSNDDFNPGTHMVTI